MNEHCQTEWETAPTTARRRGIILYQCDGRECKGDGRHAGRRSADPAVLTAGGRRSGYQRVRKWAILGCRRR